MLSSWLELPGAADRIASWSQASGLDLARLGTTASTEEITDTAVAQPLIVAATLLAYQELTQRGLLVGREFIVAGHSVGEIAAYAIAGVMAADDAVALAATAAPRWPRRAPPSRPVCRRCSAATRPRC
ncbi:malonyl CoA-acyl carrier protein transacylase [Mycobacterium kansasii]|uniref:[acyl-carrier-protein] S-malonyltransferase n=1 Tax=Mycobacterium kansasii TaxID=1768 RepID=A0A1V3WZP6_MYCKA|nr:malonyl CoA-acyl carrier protein transacylase [Mycobacterium kansasii]